LRDNLQIAWRERSCGGAVSGLGLVGFIWLYNLLVSQWQMVNNGWADVDVQLKR
jgi:hypothetical protein